jgi:hypothetical protein
MHCRICGNLTNISKAIAGACPDCTVQALGLLDPNGVPATAIRRAIEELAYGIPKEKN